VAVNSVAVDDAVFTMRPTTSFLPDGPCAEAVMGLRDASLMSPIDDNQRQVA